jgi:serine/threonine protein kinase
MVAVAQNAGEKPFKGGSLTGVLLSIVNSDPFESKAWKSQSLPSALEAVMKRALAKEPDKRYSTAAELVAALRALDVEPEPAKPVRKPRGPMKGSGRSKRRSDR